MFTSAQIHAVLHFPFILNKINLVYNLRFPKLKKTIFYRFELFLSFQCNMIQYIKMLKQSHNFWLQFNLDTRIDFMTWISLQGNYTESTNLEKKGLGT